MEMWEKCNCTSRQIKFVLNKYCSSFQLPSTLTLSVRERVRIESSKFPFPLSISLSLSSSIASNGKVHSKIPFQWEHDSLVSQLTARRKKEEALHNSRSQGLKEIERVNAELCNCARIDPLSFRYAQSKQMLGRPSWLYSSSCIQGPHFAYICSRTVFCFYRLPGKKERRDGEESEWLLPYVLHARF